MSTQICNPCAEGQVCLDNLDRYSLQDDSYYFVLNCPPNFFCGGNNVMYLVCCDGTIEQTTFTVGMTAAQRQAAISALVARCLMKDAFCTGTDTDPNNGDGTNGRRGTDPNDPLQLYGNRPMSSTSYCADGSPFTYTVPAGLFFARSQAAADAAARNFARTLSSSLKICLTGPLRTCCNNVAYSSTMVASGGVPGNFRWSVSGSLPTGLVAIPFGNNGLRIQGIPTTNGNYTFTVRATDSAGNFMAKVITIKVWGITDVTLPDGTLAADYDYQLTTTNGTAPYVYTLVGGGFPLGVDITSGGLITGVSGEVGTFSPQIKVTDHAGRTCTKTFSLTVNPGCAFDSCEEHSLVDSGEPEPGYNQFAYASDQCYFCAMTTNGAGTVLRFNKYDPDTDTFVFKASVVVASASAFSNLVYDEFQKVFVTAALQTVIYFDPATDHIDTRNAPGAPAIGYVDALVYVPAKQAVYGQFGRDGAGNFSIGHISDVIPIVIDGWWATSGGVKTHPLDLVYCPVNDSLYGANGGGAGGGLCKWNFATSTASFVNGPGGVVNVGTVFNSSSNLICCVAGVDYFELDPSTDIVMLTDTDPDISLYGVGFATIIQGQQLILCAGYDSSNPFLTTALVGISLPSLDRQVFIDSDGNYNYRNAIILSGNSIMACGDADGTANSIVIRKCLSP